jgi:hypothetical protein
MVLRSAGVLVPAAVLALTMLTGCGGEESAPESSMSKDEQTAAENLASQIVRSGSMAGGGSSRNAVTDEQATCIAEGAVTEVGLEELQSYGIVTEELLVNRSIQGVEMGQVDADALAGVFVDCIDAEALFEERFLNELPSGGSEKEQRACVEEAVTADGVQEVLSASFQGRTSPTYGELQRAVTACGDDTGAEQ